MTKSGNSQVWRTIPLILIVVLFCPIANSQVIYVDDDAAGANDGTSWENAYVYLQDALGTLGDEIHVAEGTYRPDEGMWSPPIQTDKRETSFVLRLGIIIKGGYAGSGHPDPNTHDVELYETILSGDLDGNDVDVNDPRDLITEPTRAENSYNVLNLYGTGWTSKEPPVIDGFTIVGGNANKTEQGRSYSICDSGGGMRIWGGGAKLINCTFRNNSAIARGGAVACRDGDHVFNNCTFVNNRAGNAGAVTCIGRGESTFTDCSFIGNSAGLRGGAIVIDGVIATLSNCTFFGNLAKFDGGALYDLDFSSSTLTNCLFRGNLADRGGGIFSEATSTNVKNCTFNSNLANKGGGIYACLWGSVTVHNCAFVGNSATEGGGIFNHWGSRSELANCMFTGNSAEDSGGGIFNQAHCEPVLLNCTFAGNSAPNGNAVACDSLFEPKGSSDLSVINCIFWGEENEIWNNDSSRITIRYSNVNGGESSFYDPCNSVIWGHGNIDIDPCFVEAGYWDSNGTPVEPNDDFWIEGDYRLILCSPCIDQGDPNYISEPNETDLDGNSRVIGERIDMGAYEYPFIYDKPGEGSPPGSWWKYSENPVFSEAGPGEWDNRLKACAVLKDLEEPVTKYKMWYVGGETPFFEAAGIGYATSTDGINWVRSENNPVLEPGESWNVSGFSGICVIKDGPIYKLWYEGIDDENTARIGYATSSDGINWDINNSNPVFSPGGNDAWDDEDVGNPCVVKEGSTYKMWYWGDDHLTGIDQIGLAVSNDGINWQRIRSEPVIAPDPSIWWQDGEGIGTPHVLRFNSGYVMAYHATDQSGTIRIGLATSSDGLEWKKEHNPILDIGADNSWDSIIVITGSLIQDASHLKLWYLGIDASEIIKVGLAVSCDNIVFDIEADN